MRYATLIGNLTFTPNLIRFDPSFPGLIQKKTISARSTFNTTLKIKNFISDEPSIIPVINNNFLLPNSREEIATIIFDPSKINRGVCDIFVSYIYNHLFIILVISCCEEKYFKSIFLWYYYERFNLLERRSNSTY